MILADYQIRNLCGPADDSSTGPMITPFCSEQLRETDKGAPAISSGLSSFGYDIQLADTGLKRFRHPLVDLTVNPQTGVIDHIAPIIIDPKNFDAQATIPLAPIVDETGTFYLLPPHSYALGVSVETFNIPADLFGVCYCKSTYARCGLIVNTTPLEPGWRGQLVLELANLLDLPLKVYANEGIAQVVFYEGPFPDTTYADRAGKYQDQVGIVTAMV